MGKTNTRVVKKGKAKDYQRGAKLFDYYFIVVNNQDCNLKLGGWSDGLPVYTDKNGKYVTIGTEKYYLIFK